MSFEGRAKRKGCLNKKREAKQKTLEWSGPADENADCGALPCFEQNLEGFGMKGSWEEGK